MAVKVAINGFGRIGRLAFRQMFEADGYEVVAINDLTSPAMLAHLLKYDTAQGSFLGKIGENKHTVEAGEDYIVVDGKKITIYAIKDAKDCPWGELGIDVVLECTGFYTSKAKAEAHIQAGARKVVISAPAGNDLKTIVYSVNEKTLTAEDQVISAASCTTNCLAPMANTLNKTYPIVSGIMTTVHAYTGDQMILDGPQRKGDLRRARAGAQNIVPNSTGAVGDDVLCASTSTAQIALALRTIQDHLVAGVSMNSGHDAGNDGVGLVQGVSHGSQAVGGAGSSGDDLILSGQGLLVDGVDDGLQVVAGGSRDDDLAGASLNVSLGLSLAGVEAGALQNDIDAQLAPRAILGILNGIDGDLLAVDDDVILASLNGVLVLADLAQERALSSVVLQQVSQHSGAGQIVDGDNFVAVGLKHLTESQTADTAKTIDSNFNSHSEILPRFVFFTL